jgi:predicted DNA-binding protein
MSETSLNQNYTVRLSKRQRRLLKRTAKQEQRTEADVVRLAIEHFSAKSKKLGEVAK